MTAREEFAADWDVGVIWLTRRLRRPDRMLRDRWRASRSAGTDEGGLNALDGCTDPGCGADVEAVLVVMFAVAVVITLLLLGPGLLAITIGLLEIALLLIASAVFLLGRVLFRRPWEVLARSADRTVAWRIVGYREARALVTDVEIAAAHGVDPARVRPDLLDGDAPRAALDAPSMYHRDDFRLLGRVFGLALAAGLLIVVLLMAARLN